MLVFSTDKEGAMLKGFVAALSAGYLLYRWDLARRQRDQFGGTSRALPDEVTTWEGEGGGLPDLGGQTGPAAVPTTRAASTAGPAV